MAETPVSKPAPGRDWLGGVLGAALAVPRWYIVFVLIVAGGGLLRFNGLDWDQPAGAHAPLQMHPDERFLSFVADGIDWPSGPGDYFDTSTSPLNPYNAQGINSFVYGTFPVFLTKGVSTLMGDDPAGALNAYDTNVVWGRRLTALVDTVTIVLVAGIGSYLFGRKAGLAGAALYALAVLPTQVAHFWTVDPYATFFAAATLLLSLHFVAARPGWRMGALAVALGVAVGLGLASKVTAWPLVLLPVLATGVRLALVFSAPGPHAATGRIARRVAWRDRLALRWRGERFVPGGFWTNDVSWLCLALLVAMFVFRIAQPYAFQGPNFWDIGLNERWKDDLLREIDFQNGNVDYPPFFAWASRARVLWPLENMVLWGLGPALGIAGWVGLAAGGFLLFKRRELGFVLPLALALSVFLFQGPRFVAYMRYFLPMYPVLCVMAGWAAVVLWEAARDGRGVFRPGSLALRLPFAPSLRVPRLWLQMAAIAAVLVLFQLTAFWALAFQNVYQAEHPRIAASRWIYANIPAGASITSEIWDDSLPYAIPGETSTYRIVELEPFLPDSVEKVRQLVYGRTDSPNPAISRGLVGADYVSISSHRVKDAVRQMAIEYPATIRYYELLESGELGFERVAHFEVRPSFLGIEVDDSGADESFHVYDHPEVTIYRKTAAFDADRAFQLLLEAHPERAVNILPKQGRTNGLHFSKDEWQTQAKGGTFSDVFDADGFASRWPAFWWYLWLQVAALASLPWVTWLFRALPDRGYGLSKLLGLCAVALPTWLLVAWGGPHFSGGLAWAVFGIALVAGVALGVRRREVLRTELRLRWPFVLATEAVFLIAFLAFLTLRYWNPDLWHHPQGGEKPVELAYLTAVARSSIMPPVDPWMAGGTMNYYYMGWFFLAVPMRALRIVPEIAFNLGIPTYAALAATVACSTVTNLVALSGRVRARAAGDAFASVVRPALLTGLFGAVLLVGIGNLDGAHQLIERVQSLNRAGVTPAGEVQYHWSLFSGTPVLGGAVGLLGGCWRWLVEGQALPPFDWWRPSRVHFGQFDITEFPYWSFLFADLHPHLMGLPFFGLVIAVGVAYVSSCVRGFVGQPWALAVVMGLLLGLERTVHTWDFPTAVLLVAAAIVSGQLMRTARWDLRFWHAVAHLAIAASVLVVAFTPYTSRFEVFNSGVQLAPETTQAQQFFAHFGLFVCVGLAFVVVRHAELLRERAGRVGRNPFLAVIAGPFEVVALAVFLTGLATFSWRWGLTTVALAVVALLFLGHLLWYELRTKERDIGRLLATALFFAGLGVAAGVDVVTVKNDIVRMNTVFKFGLQAWQLLAVASAYATWYAGTWLWAWEGWRATPRPGRRLHAAVASSALLLLVAASLVYVYSGTPARQKARFADLPAGLDGLAYLQAAGFIDEGNSPEPGDEVPVYLRDDEPVIRWLRDNVEGMPVIAEMVGPLYHWTGRMSWNTGLPAVVGWDWHEIAYRMDYAHLIHARRAETQRFYGDPDVLSAYEYLRKYRVSYVVVGTEEYVHGSEAAIARLAQMPGLEVAFEHGRYRIYRVSEEIREGSTPFALHAGLAPD